MKKSFFLLLLVLTAGTAIAQKTVYTTKNNVRYYPEDHYKGDAYAAERCVLDIYYPEGRKNFGTVIWFHGGGLTGGSKFVPEALKEKGLCIIAVGYRLSPKVKGKACIEDAAAAIAWVSKNIAAYGGDPMQVFVSGHSAGAYLGMMAVLDKSYLAKYGVDANRIAGLIPFSGQCITHFTIRNENGIPEGRPVIDEYAPLFHVRADAPPMLLITGDRELEMLGRYEENAYMARMMKIAGHKDIRLVEIQGYGHMMDEPAYPILLHQIEMLMLKKK